MAKKEQELNTEQKIIEVATKLFAKKGFDGTSTREICAKAEVNLSMISYYFGGKKELYQRVLDNIVNEIISYIRADIVLNDEFDSLKKEEKIEILLKIIGKMIDYFYSNHFSNDILMMLLREQVNPSVDLNPMGFVLFKKRIASILEKDENDREVTFRCLTIMGQVHSARLFNQFSLSQLRQSEYSKEDIQMLKQIIISQVKAILLNM